MANIDIGTPEVRHDLPSHVPGVAQGNRSGGVSKQAGFHTDSEGRVRASARRSTGIRARGRTPILPEMPHLTPA